MRKFIGMAILLASSASLSAATEESAAKLVEQCRKAAQPAADTLSADKVDGLVCLTYLNGVIDGINAANPRAICIPSSVTPAQLANAYVVWARHNPQLLAQPMAVTIGVAVSTVYPCRAGRKREVKAI